MKKDYLYVNSDDELSTYYSEQVDCLNIKGNAKRYERIENIIDDSDNYSELVRKLKIKSLDTKTGLKEIILDRIRVIHFVYLDNTLVLLGTFIKSTKKTPPSEIEKNNKRINLYKERKNGKTC